MKDGGEFYHHAASTLADRCRRKLVEKTTWYRRQPREVPNDGMENLRVEQPSKEEMGKVWKPTKPLQKPSTSAIKAVMFIPYTPSGGLLGRIREAEDRLHQLTDYRLKLVERSGSKLEDLLTSNNPWRGQDCGRLQCLLCSTKQKTGTNINQSCTKRSLCYEIWCGECQEEEERKIDEDADERDLSDKERRSLKEKIMRYGYVGETCRSAFERGLEHLGNYESLADESFMLKHSIDKHENEIMKEGRYRMKNLKYTKTPFERQIRESVFLQQFGNDEILNSKSEFNRCSIPRLSTKLGEFEVKEGKEEEEQEKKKELDLLYRIRMLRKERNRERGRGSNTNQSGRARKKKKMEKDDEESWNKMIDEVLEAIDTILEEQPEGQGDRMNNEPVYDVNELNEEMIDPVDDGNERTQSINGVMTDYMSNERTQPVDEVTKDDMINERAHRKDDLGNERDEPDDDDEPDVDNEFVEQPDDLINERAH